MNLNGQIGESTVDNLFAGTAHPVDIKAVKLKGGQGVLLRGTVVGIIKETELAVPVNSAATDGSEVAEAILTDNVDTTDGDIVATAYVSGLFNRKALIFGGEDTASAHERTLRTLGIYLKDNLE
jgi:hypothetical protein